MPPSNTWVLKLGGAMLAADELPAWLAACARAADHGLRCIVVAGGGASADEVRALQARWRFDDRLAHELALDTMRMHARLLCGLAPALRACSVTRTAQLSSMAEGALVWSPPVDFAPSGLPASWAVTSDSIALWLAQALDARLVLLVKSLPSAALHAQAAVDCAAQGIVDDYFPVLLASGRTPARLVSRSEVSRFERHLADASLPGVAVN